MQNLHVHLKNINFVMKTVDPCRTDKVFQLIPANDNKPSDKRMCELTYHHIYTFRHIKNIQFLFYKLYLFNHLYWTCTVGVVSMLNQKGKDILQYNTVQEYCNQPDKMHEV